MELKPDNQVVVIDRCKNHFKLSQSEFVAPEVIEGLLQSSLYVWGEDEEKEEKEKENEEGKVKEKEEEKEEEKEKEGGEEVKEKERKEENEIESDLSGGSGSLVANSFVYPKIGASFIIVVISLNTFELRRLLNYERRKREGEVSVVVKEWLDGVSDEKEGEESEDLRASVQEMIVSSIPEKV